MDTAELRNAYRVFLALARSGPFVSPPPGEWTAEQLLAHMIATDTAIAALALQVASGQRPAYDNRPSLDSWNLARIVAEAATLDALVGLLSRRGELVCAVADQLSQADLQVQVPVLILSNDQVVVDEPQPLSFLIDGLAQIHMPRHGDQLRSLQPAARL
jgi:hypothetical protein